MKATTAFAAASWVSVVMATIAQAVPPQPVIQMPQRPAIAAPNSGPDAPDPSWGPGSGGCLTDGSGYLRARIRGALSMDLDWKDARLQCSGEARPDGSGLRMTFAGLGPGGRSMRLVFGVGLAREGKAARELPTNLTVLLDGGRVFATRGDDKCTMDQLTQRPLPRKGAARAWRIEGHGFCVAPANALGGKGRILISRFDFVGRIEFS
ncbi:MAG: hypothetical protein WDM77_12580 [Steroidobacteraceae bacterium]